MCRLIGVPLLGGAARLVTRSVALGSCLHVTGTSRPSVHYGLGSLNEDLPHFVSMGTREYWNNRDGHYLGPPHDAVPLRVDPSNSLDFGRPSGNFPEGSRGIGLGLLRELNGLEGDAYPEYPPGFSYQSAENRTSAQR